MANIHRQEYDIYHDKIKELFLKGLSDRQIVSELNDSRITKPSQIQKIRTRLNLIHSCRKRDDTYVKYKEKDTKAVELISKGYSHAKVAKELGLDAASMSRRLRIYYGIGNLTDGKKQIDSKFFSNINNERKAYWLGFLFADGYVSSGNAVELVVQSRDRNHLEKFKTDINSFHVIGSKKVILNGKDFYSNRITFHDTTISDDLKRLGCINSKSFKIQVPDLDTLELYRHFFRGYFDGDGSIVHNRGYVSAEISCASYSFIKSVCDHAYEKLGIHMTISQDDRSSVYNLRTMARDEGIRYLQYLYHDSNIYLDRKYKSFQAICRSESILPKTQNDEDGIKRGWRNVN